MFSTLIITRRFTELAARYWRTNVVTHAAYNPDVECFVALLLNTRRRVKGHVLVSIGTLDCILAGRARRRGMLGRWPRWWRKD